MTTHILSQLKKPILKIFAYRSKYSSSFDNPKPLPTIDNYLELTGEGGLANQGNDKDSIIQVQ